MKRPTTCANIVSKFEVFECNFQVLSNFLMNFRNIASLRFWTPFASFFATVCEAQLRLCVQKIFSGQPEVGFVGFVVSIERFYQFGATASSGRNRCSGRGPQSVPQCSQTVPQRHESSDQSRLQCHPGHLCWESQDSRAQSRPQRYLLCFWNWRGLQILIFFDIWLAFKGL